MPPLAVLGRVALCVALLAASHAPGLGQPLPSAAPDSQGFDAARLARLEARMQRFVDEGQHAGVLTLVARRGRIVASHAVGMADRGRQRPMTRDTIVRIYSMSKIVTSVAVMMLVEEGRLRLDDPVSHYLPALSSPMVFTGGTAAAPERTPATRPITIRHLLTHTSGLLYGFGQDPVDTIYNDAALMQARSIDDFIARAARVPLGLQPGTRFAYGISTDVLGAVVQQVSGQPFEVFVRTRIFEPLRMPDTGFTVPAAERHRLAAVYTTGKDGRLTPGGMTGGPDELPYPDPEGRGFPSGGGGLFSTIDDYARFAQMLLNGGELDGVRLLGRKTVEAMRTNHLVHLDRPRMDAAPSEGFGLGVSVRTDLASGPGLGSVGQFGWSGAATTLVTIDPVEEIVALVFTQHMPYNEHDLFGIFRTMMYAALVDAPPRP